MFCADCGITSAELKERKWAAMVTHSNVIGKRTVRWSLCLGCAVREARQQWHA